MNGFNKNQDKRTTFSHSRALEVLSRALRKRFALKAGVISMLFVIGALNGDSVFAQRNVRATTAPAVSASPWTNQDGREVADLSARKSVAKRNPIRLVASLSQDDLAVPDSLLDESTPIETGRLDSMLPEPIDEAETLPPSTITPLSTAGTPESAPIAQPAPAAPKTISTDNNVSDYQQGSVQPEQSGAKKNFTGAVEPQAQRYTNPYSTNPYSRIGQAEYNPNQFYGGGGNYTDNGYRQVPPVEAYGQSMCGGSCDGYYCCGVLGGILRNTQLEGGALSMRSPMDLEDDGNAGAHAALNWASIRPVFYGLNVQAGVRGVFTDFDGVFNRNGFTTDDSRTQFFWTAGLYFRAPICANGWSGGVVYDSLTESYYRDYELSQLRAELSYNFTNFCEIGFRGAFALDEDWCDFIKLGDDEYIEAKATGTSYYTLFLRKRFMEGAEVTFFGGGTEWSEGLFGASAEAPVTDSFAVRGSATFVFPTERGLTDREEETWNMSMGFVWYIGGNARGCSDSQRPLFDVADNGSFLQNFLR